MKMAQMKMFGERFRSGLSKLGYLFLAFMFAFHTCLHVVCQRENLLLANLALKAPRDVALLCPHPLADRDTL